MTESESFNPKKAADCSVAIKYIFSWIMAMYDYNRIYLQTKPLREKLNAVQKVVREKTEELRVKKEQL